MTASVSPAKPSWLGTLHVAVGCSDSLPAPAAEIWEHDGVEPVAVVRTVEGAHAIVDALRINHQVVVEQQQALRAVERQRDELLRALRGLLHKVDLPQQGMGLAADIARARAVIASADRAS